MGTIIETGSLKEALNIVELAYEQVKDCERLYGSLKFDIRHGKSDRLKSKIESVEKRIGRVINKS